MERTEPTEVTLIVSTPILVIILLSIVSVSFLLYKAISLRAASPSVNNESPEVTQNVVTEENGKQIITIIARGSYNPRIVTAKSGIPTILRMKTNNSYGCERAFSIPKMGIQKTLPATGDTDIDLGTQEKGSRVFGTCSMGMYTLSISFN